MARELQTAIWTLPITPEPRHTFSASGSRLAGVKGYKQLSLGSHLVTKSDLLVGKWGLAVNRQGACLPPWLHPLSQPKRKAAIRLPEKSLSLLPKGSVAIRNFRKALWASPYQMVKEI